MKRPVLLACLFLVLAAGLGCGSERDDPTGPERSMATLTGRVTVGGSPVGGAEVSLTGAGVTRTASSDEAGFTFADLPPGTYTLTASLQGHACDPATAEMAAGETATADIACAREIGWIRGTVTADGVPMPGALVQISPPAIEVRPTRSDGVFTAAVPPGTYSLTAIAPGTTCGSAQVTVEVRQAIAADIACQPTGRIEGWIRWPAASSGAQVVSSGPIGREARTAASGRFVFDAVPVGDYTLTATGGSEVCQPAAATVRAGNITSVDVLCGDSFFGEIQVEGEWSLRFPHGDDEDFDGTFSQAGDCPPPLSPEVRTASIAFDAASGTLSIEELDPDLTITGSVEAATDLDRDFGRAESRAFTGLGRAVRADGSSIRSDLSGWFSFAPFDSGFFFGGTLTRVHADANDVVVCTEGYAVDGSKR